MLKERWVTISHEDGGEIGNKFAGIYKTQTEASKAAIADLKEWDSDDGIADGDTMLVCYIVGIVRKRSPEYVPFEHAIKEK